MAHAAGIRHRVPEASAPRPICRGGPDTFDSLVVGGGGVVSGGRRNNTPRTVTARAMSILAVFSQERPVLGLVDISQRTGLAPSTIHRFVAELTEWGALARTPDLRYRIGPMLLRLGAIAAGGYQTASDRASQGDGSARHEAPAGRAVRDRS